MIVSYAIIAAVVEIAVMWYLTAVQEGAPNPLDSALITGVGLVLGLLWPLSVFWALLTWIHFHGWSRSARKPR